MYKDFLSIFEPHVGPHSLGLMTIECEFCTALHFIQEAISSSMALVVLVEVCRPANLLTDVRKHSLSTYRQDKHAQNGEQGQGRTGRQGQ